MSCVLGLGTVTSPMSHGGVRYPFGCCLLSPPDALSLLPRVSASLRMSLPPKRTAPLKPEGQGLGSGARGSEGPGRSLCSLLSTLTFISFSPGKCWLGLALFCLIGWRGGRCPIAGVRQPWGPSGGGQVGGGQGGRRGRSGDWQGVSRRNPRLASLRGIVGPQTSPLAWGGQPPERGCGLWFSGNSVGEAPPTGACSIPRAPLSVHGSPPWRGEGGLPEQRGAGCRVARPVAGGEGGERGDGRAGGWLWAGAQPPVLQDHLRPPAAWVLWGPHCGSCLPRGGGPGPRVLWGHRV